MVLSPAAGYSSSAQVVDVQATVRGVLGQPEALTSATAGNDAFTYSAGPLCGTALTCPGPYYPKLVVSCPDQVSFYLSPGAANQALLDTSTSYTAATQGCGAELGACYGSPQNGSCSTFSLEASEFACGVPNFCNLCKKAGGVCSLGANPLCCTSICTSTVPEPPCP